MEQQKDVSSNPGLYLLDAKSISSLVLTVRVVSRHCQMSPGKQNCSKLRTTGVCEAEMTPLNPFLDMLTALQKTHSGIQESWIQVLVLSQRFCMFCLSYLVCEMKDYLRYLGAHLPLSILTMSSYGTLNTF